ncbi:hypothetical protein ACFFSY_30405 [Paenibacillus aurantiacus]|uniref:Uncharacterized protein n=1 Tax=Paenibacillus aurantiacus TaxID=1936118 RepID=A0ABV5KYH6_9BACL
MKSKPGALIALLLMLLLILVGYATLNNFAEHLGETYRQMG